MAVSKEAICNSALVRVGADRIVSINDDSREAKLCREQYDKIRGMLFRAHPWNFALARASLAADPTAPAFGYDYRFQLPTDCFRVLHVNDDEGEWVKEGNYILTDDSDCEVQYIADVPVGMHDASFDEVFAAKMAENISVDLTTNASLKVALSNEYTSLLREARAFDAQEASITKVRTRTFLNSRR